MIPVKWLEVKQAIDIIGQGGEGNPDVTDITFDSRLVTPGAVFVAIPGFKAHGDSFILAALKKGSAAVVSENPHPELTVPWIQVSDPRLALGLLGKTLWNVDFQKITMVGVTGTNGKTTTASLYHTLFRVLHGLQYSWMFGTIAYSLGKTMIDAPHTTPEASDILRYIGTAQQRPKAVSMEVSSHALTLHRVAGFLFDIAVWTNLTQDHLDFHGTMEAYYTAKKKLFTAHMKKDGIAVVNSDDAWGQRLIKELDGIAVVTYGRSEQATVRVVDAACTWTQTEVGLVYRNKEMRFKSCLAGAFNVYNMAALIAGALAKGISQKEIQDSLQVMHAVAGRMERIPVPFDFPVVVDYAHTPDALVNMLTTARNLTKGRLICVFGCGGDRDKTKRPLMAEAVARCSDEAIVTSDNPRTERPEKILEEITQGIPLDFPHMVIADRREAIRMALTMGTEGDCVVIAGKGHETYQEIKGKRYHFDDREVVRELSRELKAGTQKQSSKGRERKP